MTCSLHEFVLQSAESVIRASHTLAKALRISGSPPRCGIHDANRRQRLTRPDQRLGIIGLGLAGTAMAERLLAGGLKERIHCPS
jgi:phosphoglycerate dehydrogenase-like enzyme